MDDEVIPLKAEVSTSPNRAIDAAIQAWLTAKFTRTQSYETVAIYRETIRAFRTYLAPLDLDAPIDDVVLRLQQWAIMRSPVARRAGAVSSATFNQRVAIISSFYRYAHKSGKYTGGNPVDYLERAKVQKYRNARPIDSEEVKVMLQKIDRTTSEGQRDYLLLQVALNTGHRAKELALLTRASLHVGGERVTLTFAHCKGDKTLDDQLSVRLSKMLVTYLEKLYGTDVDHIPAHSPLWVSFSDRSAGKGIGVQTIANICKRYLGVSTVHTTRHTFAHTMEQSGASVSEIQARLGHESIATTGVYLARLKSAYNPYADIMADKFGLEEE